NWAYWDGRDDTGNFVPDGTYGWQATATHAGHTATTSSEFGVDQRTPGRLVAPSENATLSGDRADFAFAPTAGVQVDGVTFVLDCFCYWGWWGGTAGEDGVFRASGVDTSVIWEGT